MTRPWLSPAAAGAIVVLAVGLAVSSAQRPPSPGQAAALTSTYPADGREPAATMIPMLKCGVPAIPGAARDLSTVDAATDGDAAAMAEAAGSAVVAAGSAHQHGVDPVSAALLAIDGVVALAVVVLLVRRPPPRPSRPPS